MNAQPMKYKIYKLCEWKSWQITSALKTKTSSVLVISIKNYKIIFWIIGLYNTT